jgi:hypothetical protein
MLRKTLKSLPKSLDETYDWILLQIDELYSDDVHRVLEWLAFSAQPMTLAEVVEVLRVNLDDDVLLESEQCLSDPQDILTICSSLVTASGFNSNPENKEGKDTGVLNITIDCCSQWLDK